MSSQIDLKRILFVLGRILIVAFLLFAVIISGKFSNFLNGPGLAFVLLGAVAMALMSFSVPEIRAAFKHAAGRPGAGEELQKSAYFWESSARNVWMLGILGTIISFVIGLATCEGGIGDIVSRMAVSFLSMVYGIILGVICFVPALKLTGELIKQPAQEAREVLEKPGENAAKTLRFEKIIGYVLFIVLMGWTIISPLTSEPPDGPLNPLEMFIYWPALLVVIGGTIALVMFVGDASSGRSFTLSFALTGLLGSLMGFVQGLIGFSSQGIKDVASAVTFIISSCFVAMVGMMLIGIPLEDRSVKAGRNYKRLSLSRIAWYVFPLVALIFLILTFVIVLTPVRQM